jgi:hypothetical protein
MTLTPRTADEWELSVRAGKGLISFFSSPWPAPRAELSEITIDMIAAVPRKAFLETGNVGKKTVKEIESWLRHFGMAFADECPHCGQPIPPERACS